MNAYFSCAITGLILFGLVVFLRIKEKAESSIKYLSVASIISFALSLMLMLIACIPDAFIGSLFDPLANAVVIGIGYVPFLIVSSLHVASFEDTIFPCLVFVFSFMLYTFLIFIVVRIFLYLKNKFWSGKALVPPQ